MLFLFSRRFLEMFFTLSDILCSSSKGLSFCERRPLASGESGRIQQALHWRFGLVMGLDDFRAAPFFADKFDRGHEEIEVVMPLGGVELIEQFDGSICSKRS